MPTCKLCGTRVKVPRITYRKKDKQLHKLILQQMAVDLQKMQKYIQKNKAQIYFEEPIYRFLDNTIHYINSELKTSGCCDKESRNLNGGCDNCGDPCL